jgi:hypothetical protein
MLSCAVITGIVAPLWFFAAGSIAKALCLRLVGNHPGECKMLFNPPPPFMRRPAPTCAQAPRGRRCSPSSARVRGAVARVLHTTGAIFRPPPPSPSRAQPAPAGIIITRLLAVGVGSFEEQLRVSAWLALLEVATRVLTKWKDMAIHTVVVRLWMG